ncbi:MAG: PLDc_N domain-containing protein [Dactylosporangium sp.]|nr:PLD nuclease N-terminal domain-containing protein [Dactylosporangium sp.]NNJ59456.1 PLDc_N domain-containing protein [Dactylosporangium sp.]
MGRLLLLLLFINVMLLAVALIDCLSTERDEVRGLPKAVWVLIILLFPAVGPGVWFASGRPVSPESRPNQGGPLDRLTGKSRSPRPLGPDDDPEFLKGLSTTARKADEDRLRAWEDDLHRREEELRRHADDEGPPDDTIGR